MPNTSVDTGAQAPLPATSSVITYTGDIAKDALAYQAAGSRYAVLTAKLLTTRWDTLILAGYGAGIRVEHDRLIVTDGHTHYPHVPVVHTLHRGLHTVQRIICVDPKGSLSFSALE
ncbi:MAG: hypothetical protein ACLQUY_16905 [Ktedonobacterales bacterium]